MKCAAVCHDDSRQAVRKLTFNEHSEHAQTAPDPPKGGKYAASGANAKPAPRKIDLKSEELLESKKPVAKRDKQHESAMKTARHQALEAFVSDCDWPAVGFSPQALLDKLPQDARRLFSSSRSLLASLDRNESFDVIRGELETKSLNRNHRVVADVSIFLSK